MIEIKELCNEWTEEFDDMSTRDALFALYDDRMISGVELDSLMDRLDGITLYK